MQLIPRHLAPTLRRAVRKFPVVSLTGPRQAGKTTLLQHQFAEYAYVSLERPDERALALTDPLGFLARFSGPVIIDEAQHAPDLFSYIQVAVDEDRALGRFILSGSQNFLLMRRITQSLAGRVRITHLMPLSRGELTGRSGRTAAELLTEVAVDSDTEREARWTDQAVRGSYPPIHERRLDPEDEWYGQYLQTYLQRDVRDLTQVGNLNDFSKFISLCAGRVGGLLDLSSLGDDCGVGHDTVRRWLSVLETGFQVFRLYPYLRNFRKRLTKRPKIYFTDTGLLCWLLGIRTADQLWQHPLRGAVFENFIIAEVLKAEYNAGAVPRLSFFRDQHGSEVDLIVETSHGPHAVEIKSGETVATDMFRGLRFWGSVTGEDGPRTLVYGGDEDRPGPDGISVRSWRGWR